MPHARQYFLTPCFTCSKGSPHSHAVGLSTIGHRLSDGVLCSKELFNTPPVVSLACRVSQSRLWRDCLPNLSWDYSSAFVMRWKKAPSRLFFRRLRPCRRTGLLPSVAEIPLSAHPAAGSPLPFKSPALTLRRNYSHFGLNFAASTRTPRITLFPQAPQSQRTSKSGFKWVTVIALRLSRSFEMTSL